MFRVVLTFFVYDEMGTVQLVQIAENKFAFSVRNAKVWILG